MRLFLRITIGFLFVFNQAVVAQQKVVLQKMFEAPAFFSSDTPVFHTGYVLLYNEIHEQATWVAYELTREETTKSAERSNKFLVDPQINTGSANDGDYAGSGYDRGHLAPAADLSWSEQSMKESFYYSNMSPQVPSFNRGVWKRLEEQVRDWAVELNQIFVVTGPLLSDTLSRKIGANRVTVPRYYYKAIVDTINRKGIAFVLPNQASSDSLQRFVITIDSLQTLTGIDFFPLLTSEKAQLIKKQVCMSCWNWKTGSMKTQPNTITQPVKRTTSVRCIALTQKGTRCKLKTFSLNSKCVKHGGN